jgi:hypothetical protein
MLTRAAVVISAVLTVRCASSRTRQEVLGAREVAGLAGSILAGLAPVRHDCGGRQAARHTGAACFAVRDRKGAPGGK